MQQENTMYVTLECPNTIFQIYIHDECEKSKFDIFMNNIRYIEHLKVKDIYEWCNHQRFSYKTHFNYNRRVPVWRNMKAYFTYFRQKTKNQPNFQPV